MRPSSASVGAPLPPELAALRRSRVARRVLGLGRRLRRVVRAHPMPVDSALALAVLVFGLVGILVADKHGPGAGHAPAALIVVTMAGQVLPLVWRRRAPLAVLTVVLASCVVQWSADAWLRSTVGLMIALYSFMRYDQLKRMHWVGLGTAAGIAVAAFNVEFFSQHALTNLFLLYCAVAAACALGLVARVRRAQLDALADRAARLEVEREQRVQLATLAERSRVSREMHDIVGHNLAVIVGLADGAARSAATDPAAGADALRLIAGTGRQALGELRQTLGALRDRPGQPHETAALSPQPGIADLGTLLQRIQAAGPRISYRTAGDLDALAPGMQLAVYRIVQEALTNSLKHAGPATSVRITLRATDEEVEVHIQDTGPPEATPGHPAARPAGPPGQNGQGLVGIAERAALSGGTAHAGPAGDGGWSVRAAIPRRSSRARQKPPPSPAPPRPFPHDEPRPVPREEQR